VCALQFNGRGDIYGGHEVALRVQKLIPHAKVVFSVLKPRCSPSEAVLFAQKDVVDISEIQQLEKWPIEEESAVLEAISTFKKIIVFPTYHDSLLPVEILQRNDDVIKLREYSVGTPELGIVNGPTYTLGLDLSQGEKGVLLPDQWVGKVPPRNQDPAKIRLLHLENVEPALSKAILGNDFSADAIEAFTQSSKLYMGYYHQPDVFFCFINALLIAKKGNLVICSTQKRPSKLMDNIEQALEDNGFEKLKIVEFSDFTQSKMSAIGITSNGKRTCTLIFYPALAQTKMDVLLRASEDEALATGDLSPFQFMAYRKTIVYDTRIHKHESAQAMIHLASQFDPRFQKLLSMAFFGAEEPGSVVHVLALENGMARWIKALDEDPSLKENWNKFIGEVFSKRDFTPHLAEIVEKRWE
jgi:hypothetical protein